jgi:hypothetical protein
VPTSAPPDLRPGALPTRVAFASPTVSRQAGVQSATSTCGMKRPPDANSASTC